MRLDLVHAADIDREFHGFYYEVAGMAATILECVFPWKKGAFAEIFAEYGGRYRYTMIVGVGWAGARLPALWARRGQGRVAGDPILRVNNSGHTETFLGHLHETVCERNIGCHHRHSISSLHDIGHAK